MGGEPSGRRRLLLGFVGVAISVVAIGILVRSVDVAGTTTILRSATAGPLLLVLAALAAQAALRAARWRVLLAGAVRRPLPFVPVLMAMLAGYLGNAVLPARLGEAVRAGMLGRALRVAVPTVLGSAVLERVIDVLVLAVIGAGMLIILAVPVWVVGIVAVSVFGALLGLVVLLALSRRPDVIGWLSPAVPAVVRRTASELAVGLRVVEQRPVLGLAGGLTFGAWCLDATIFWLVGQSLGLEISPPEAVLVSVVGVLSTAVPSAPGYVGTFELGVVAASALAGVTGPSALAFAVLAHGITLLPLAVAGALSIVLLQSVRHPSAHTGFIDSTT